MDSNASIEPSRLQHPKVLVIVATVCELVWCFKCLLLLSLALIQPFIYHINVLVNILINQFHNAQELFDSVTHIVFQIIEDNGQRDDVIDVHSLGLVVGFQVYEKVVFCGKLAVAFYVVH